MEPDTIFIEDGAKVHLSFAKAVRKALNIQGFSQGWPPSSPNLNPIKKVWRWIKSRITQIDKFPTTLNKLKQVVQDLWDEIDPYWFIKHIESMPKKLKEVIKRRGGATVY
jgi:DDE superfamily endonuclease